MSKQIPDPPETFTDEERELWRRVYSLPWIESSDFIIVGLLVQHSAITHMIGQRRSVVGDLVSEVRVGPGIRGLNRFDPRA